MFRRLCSRFLNCFRPGANQLEQTQLICVSVDQPVTFPFSPHQSQQTQPIVPVGEPVTSPSSPRQSQQTQPSGPVDQPVTSPSSPHQSQQTQPSAPVDQPVTSPSSPYQYDLTLPNVPVDQPVTSPSSPHQSQQTRLRKPQALTECILIDLAGNLGNKWIDLATHLGISTAKIENFQADFPHSQERQTFLMLQTWWQRWDHSNDEGEIGAVDALCAALEKTGRTDLVQLLRGSVKDVGHFDPDPYRNEFIKYYQDEMSVVSLLPWLPSEVRKIDDIYVKPKLQERQGKIKKRENGRIDSHEDMLNLEYEDGEPVRFILLSGIAGSGKTTIVSKIATDWAEQKPESQLSKFTFLVALSMREFKGNSDLTEAIYDQILAKDTKLSRQSLKNYLRSHAKEVLVVLDGADEYDKEGSQLPSEGFIIDIISNKIFRGCTVIVTTRPHMVDKLYKLNPSFVHIETRGFSDEGVQKYIQKFFKGVDRKVSAGLRRHLKAYGTLLSLARTPIMLLLKCLVWSDEQKLPETLTELFKEALLFILKRHFQKSGMSNPEDKELLEKQLIDLLQTLGKEALDSLMLPGQKLVFEAGDFGNSEVVAKACKIGFLSKENIRSKSRAVERVTFFHTTFQEAIAGFYWASLVESDDELFESNLSKVDKSNALGMEYLMRFCCGWNVKAAESLLRHVETFGLKTEVQDDPGDLDPNEPFRRLWILLHFEARSKELHRIAETIFNHVFLVTMNGENDFSSALKFLVECATSSGQSSLTKLQQVMIKGVSSKEETSIATDILRNSPKVTDVFVSTDRNGKEALNEVRLGEALSEMQSLEKLEINGSIRYVNVSAILHNLSRSRTSLKTLKLRSCQSNRRDWAMNSQLRELVLQNVSLQDYKSPHKLTGIQIQTTNLETLKIIGHVVACNIPRFFRSYPNLKFLSIKGVDFLSEDLTKPVCNLLSTAPKLQVVDLEGISLCRDSSPSLAEQLKNLKELHELKLSFSRGLRSKDIGLITLATDVLPSLCNLRVLEVFTPKAFSVNAEAFLAVMRWVCASPSMYELTLYRCNFKMRPQLDYTKSKPDSIDAVNDIHQPTQGSLQKLSIGGISLGPCRAAFIELLKQMPLLKRLLRLDMEDISFEESDWTDLVDVLEGCQQLQVLNLSQNRVKNRVFHALLMIIPRLPNLQQLVLPLVRGKHTDMVRDCLLCGTHKPVHSEHTIFEFNKQGIEALVSVVKRYTE